MKSKKNTKSFIFELQVKNCLHSVVLTIWRNAAETQAKHNQEMEQKFTASQNHERALMQQQFRHGLQYGINLMDELFGVHPSGAFLFQYQGSTKQSKCFISPKVRKMFETLQQLRTELDATPKAEKGKGELCTHSCMRVHCRRCRTGLLT